MVQLVWMALTVPVWPTTLGSTASTGTVSCSVGSPFAVQVRQALLVFLRPKVTHPARMVPVTMATAPATMATLESVVTQVRHYSYYYGDNGRGRAGGAVMKCNLRSETLMQSQST